MLTFSKEEYCTNVKTPIFSAYALNVSLSGDLLLHYIRLIEVKIWLHIKTSQQETLGNNILIAHLWIFDFICFITCDMIFLSLAKYLHIQTK